MVGMVGKGWGLGWVCGWVGGGWGWVLASLASLRTWVGLWVLGCMEPGLVGWLGGVGLGVRVVRFGFGLVGFGLGLVGVWLSVIPSPPS